MTLQQLMIVSCLLCLTLVLFTCLYCHVALLLHLSILKVLFVCVCVFGDCSAGTVDFVTMLISKQDPLPNGVSRTFYVRSRDQQAQDAYQLSTAASVGNHTRHLFPSVSHTPTSSYSLSATVKLRDRALSSNWCLLKFLTAAGGLSSSIELHAKTREAVFRFVTSMGLSEVRAAMPGIFDGQWHKMLVVMAPHHVKWVLDCRLVAVSVIHRTRQPIDQSGTTYVGVRRNSNKGMTIAIHDLTLYCHQTAAEQSHCEQVCSSISIVVMGKYLMGTHNCRHCDHFKLSGLTSQCSNRTVV